MYEPLGYPAKGQRQHCGMTHPARGGQGVRTILATKIPKHCDSWLGRRALRPYGGYPLAQKSPRLLTPDPRPQTPVFFVNPSVPAYPDLPMEIDPELLDPSTRYKLLIGSVVPRPIAFVSSLSPQGVANLAPFSYFNAAGHKPMALMFSISLKPDGHEKDTLRNGRPVSEGGTGEYVVNLAIAAYAHQVAECAEALPYGESEFDYVNLSSAPSRVIQPPRVAESPVAFECRTLQIVPVGEFHIVIGQVVHLFVRDDVLDEHHRINVDKVGALGRMAGYEYCRTGDRFEIPNGFPKSQSTTIPPRD